MEGNRLTQAWTSVEASVELLGPKLTQVAQRSQGAPPAEIREALKALQETKAHCAAARQASQAHNRALHMRNQMAL
ncbi:hypothetical protein WJX73_002389 [Symbiochloris irregularis]|uniref:Uncharacterized protein n=1 Tax=Symbiochloris irregularis TaxID=706552 RepID=A0AAW1Q3H6_9CHLO